MRRRRAHLLWVAATLIALACNGSQTPPPARAVTGDGPPSIVGVITAVDAGRVRIEEDPTQTFGSAKAVVRLVDATRIVGPDGRTWPADSLRVGRRVRAWFTGPVAESYPVQAAAAAIAID